MIGFVVKDKFIDAGDVAIKRIAAASDGDAESQLWSAVICQAISDLSLPSSKDPVLDRSNERARQDAEEFLFGSRLNPVANVIGLNPEWVRETVVGVAEAAMGQDLSV